MNFLLYAFWVCKPVTLPALADQSGMKFSLWGYFWSIIWINLTVFWNKGRYDNNRKPSGTSRVENIISLSVHSPVRQSMLTGLVTLKMHLQVFLHSVKNEFWFKYFYLLDVTHKQNKYLVQCKNLPPISSCQLLEQCDVLLSTRFNKSF